MEPRLKTRDDTARCLLDLIRPLKRHYTESGSALYVGSTGAHYGKKSAGMEGFSRILWGLGSLFARENFRLLPEELEEIQEWKEISRKGILAGTDPQSDGYWGDMFDYDQKMVECAALVTSMMLAKKDLWDCFSEQEQEWIYQWLNQINHYQVHGNNWRFFRILVNLMFEMFGLERNLECEQDDQALIESCYEGNGWYHDGNKTQLDYYIPFAFHYYGLIWGAMKKDDAYGKELKKRAEEFYSDFIYWFSADGNEIPFGRSLTYRFAHSAFFAAAAFAGLEQVDYGVMKALTLGNLRTWLSRPIFDNEGILTLGYGYQNLCMTERYNAPVSPYWSFKTFLILALPEEHPFWQSEEKRYQYEKKKKMDHPHMLITHDDHDHVLAYVTGQGSMEHGNCTAKYEKFVYSNQFGFSVSRGSSLLEGAFDSTLAAAEAGEDLFRSKKQILRFDVQEDFVEMEYNLMKNVKVRSIVIPFGAWHVRIHEIETDRNICLADGGFSLNAEDEAGKYSEDMIHQEQGSACADFPWGMSKAVSLLNGDATVVVPFPNTNLFWNLTVLPTVKAELKAGKNVLVNAFYGELCEDARNEEKQIPEFLEKEAEYIVSWNGHTVRVLKGD